MPSMLAKFGLKNSFRQQHLIKTGKHLDPIILRQIPLETLSPQAREVIVLVNPELSKEFNLSLRVFDPKSNYYQYNLWQADFEPQSTEPKEWETLLFAFQQTYIEQEKANQDAMQKALDKAIIEAEKAVKEEATALYGTNIDGRFKGLQGYEHFITLLQQIAENEKALQERNRLESETRRQQEKTYAQQYEEEQKALADEKVRWISEHGSEKLRKKFAAGYTCHREYVVERAAKEYPGFTVDYANKSRWEDCYCPSDKAFALAEKHKGLVVYLTQPASLGTDTEPEEDEYGYFDVEPFEKGEAVVIQDFCGKYDLVHLMN